MASRTVASQVRPGQTETLSVPMPWRANMIGVSFVDPSRSQKGVTIDGRAHTATEWSAWEELGGDDNGAMGVEAQHESPRVSTDPLWVGTADRVEIRLAVAKTVRAIHDVRVHLINTLGDATPQSFVSRALGSIGRFLSMHAAPSAQPAEAWARQPAIISRGSWGANPAYLNLPCPGIAPVLQMAFVHHTDTTNSYAKSQSAAIVRGIYAYHTNTRGYCDIAYNFLIDKYGQIFEGRNGGVANNVIGAHTGGYNYETVGVALLGNYGTARPSLAMLNALNALLAWRLDIAHVPPIGTVTMRTGTGNDHHAAGTLVKFNRIAGHRDASYTSCPGAYVYQDLTWIRNHVNAIGRPKIYLPQLDRVNLRPDGDTRDEMIRFTAGFSGTLTWILKFIDSKGVVQRTLTGTWGAMKVYWNGTTAAGAFVPNGLYTWRLDAHDSTNHWATGVSGPFTVVTSHPDGTLLLDATGKYVIDGGAARAVDPIAYASNFGTLPAIPTGPKERARYTTGLALGLRNGTLLVDPSTSPATRYIWSDGALRKFSTSPADTFSVLGYKSGASIVVTPTYLAGLALGTDVTDVTTHPDGTAVKNTVTGKTFVVESGNLRPISALALASLYRSTEVVTASPSDLALPIGAAVPVRDGTFIKPADAGTPWLVSDGTKHRFVSSAFATLMGYTSSMMLSATAADINAIPTGARIG